MAPTPCFCRTARSAQRWTDSTNGCGQRSLRRSAVVATAMRRRTPRHDTPCRGVEAGWKREGSGLPEQSRSALGSEGCAEGGSADPTVSENGRVSRAGAHHAPQRTAAHCTAPQRSAPQRRAAASGRRAGPQAAGGVALRHRTHARTLPPRQQPFVRCGAVRFATTNGRSLGLRCAARPPTVRCGERCRCAAHCAGKLT
jgi:hypothetical protein